MGWYYAVSNQRLGPVSDTEFTALVANGTIGPTTLVWRQGMAGWLPYAQVAPAPAEDALSAVCAVSGQRYPKAEMLQYEDRWVSAEHRDVFFQRLREGLLPSDTARMPGAYGYAGFWLRLLAWVIDRLALGAATMVVYIPLALGFYGYIASLQGKPSPLAVIVFQLLSNTLTIGIALTYDIWMVRRYDATLGKMALGLKLLRADGAKLSKGRIVGRYFAHAINVFTLCIGYMMAGWDDEKRALHDRVCDTRVIKTRP